MVPLRRGPPAANHPPQQLSRHSHQHPAGPSICVLLLPAAMLSSTCQKKGHKGVCDPPREMLRGSFAPVRRP